MSKFNYPLNAYQLNALLKLIRVAQFFFHNSQIEEKIGCTYGYLNRFTSNYKSSISEEITLELISLYENPETYIKKMNSFKKRVHKQKIKTTENSISSKDLLKKLNIT